MIIFYLSQVGAGVSTNWLDITGTRPPIGTTFRIVADKAMAIGLGVSMITIYWTDGWQTITVGASIANNVPFRESVRAGDGKIWEFTFAAGSTNASGLEIVTPNVPAEPDIAFGNLLSPEMYFGDNPVAEMYWGDTLVYTAPPQSTEETLSGTYTSPGRSMIISTTLAGPDNGGQSPRTLTSNTVTATLQSITLSPGKSIKSLTLDLPRLLLSASAEETYNYKNTSYTYTNLGAWGTQSPVTFTQSQITNLNNGVSVGLTAPLSGQQISWADPDSDYQFYMYQPSLSVSYVASTGVLTIRLATTLSSATLYMNGYIHTMDIYYSATYSSGTTYKYDAVVE